MEPRWRVLRRALPRVVGRLLARHRRSLAATAAGLAALSALSFLRPGPAPTEAVAVAARDLFGGSRLAPDDVGAVELPTGAVPDGSYPPAEAPVGRLLAAPVRRGEPLTDAAVVGPGLASALPAGRVLTSVQVVSTTALMVRPGDVVDVVAGRVGDPTGRADAGVVASGASVVSVPRAETGAQVRALVLAVDEAAALSVAQAALVAPLQLLVRPG